MKKILTYLSFILILVSCRKEEIIPEDLPEDNAPIFYVRGLIDGQEIELKAGENNSKVQNQVIDRNGMDYTYSEFVFNSEVLRIGIFSGNNELPPASAKIKEGDTLVLAGKTIETLANFDRYFCSNYSQISQIKWYKDGEFVGIDQFEINEPGNYHICGEFTFKNGESKMVCNSILVGFYEDLDVKLNHEMLVAGESNFWVSGLDSSSVSKIEWKVNDVFESSDKSPTILLPPSLVKVTAEITGMNNKKYIRNILVDGSNTGYYSEDFERFVKPIELQWDHAVGIDIKKNDQWYSTFQAQNYKSKMLIEKITFFEVNSQGKTVFKIQGQIDAKLNSSISNESLLVKLNFVAPFILN